MGQEIHRWADALADDPQFSADLYRANLTMRMAGHVVVRDVELEQRDRALLLRRRALQRVPDEPLLDMPFPEAVSHFLSRELVDPDRFAAMSDQERMRSFTMSRVASEQIRRTAWYLVQEAASPDGIGMDEFIAQVRRAEANLGIEPSSRGYLDNVYRTATAVSYGAGRLEQQTDPVVAKALPFWQYVTAADGRVRPRHAALHDHVYRVGDPEALKVYPPNGFRCRCVMVSISEEDMKEAGLELSVPDVSVPDEGFRAPPTVALADDSGTAPLPPPQPSPVLVPDIIPDPEPQGLPPVRVSREEATEAREAIRAFLALPEYEALLFTDEGARARRAIKRMLRNSGYEVDEDTRLTRKDLAPGVAACRYHDGRVAMRAGSREEGEGESEQIERSIQVLIHEEMHARSAGRESYRGAGAVIEEIATEVSARRVARDVPGIPYGVHDLPPSTGSPYRPGAYDRYIVRVKRIVMAIAGVDDNGANDILERASFAMTRSASPEEHVRKWVDMTGLPQEQRDRLFMELRDLVKD